MKRLDGLLLVLPIVVPLGTAVALLLVRGRLRVERSFSAAGAVLLFLSAAALLARVSSRGILAVQMGSWPAPFGITLVADLLSGIMVLLAGLIGLAGSIYALGTIDEGRERHGFHPVYHVMLMGVCGAFLTGDIFNLYVWFEVLLIASFVLLALGGTRDQMEAALKYVTLNLVSSAVFLSVVGVLYGMTGTLNMADLAGVFAGQERPPLTAALAVLFFVAFGIKAAVFPLFFWLPASYHTPPPAVAAVFAGLLTKVGVYALFRVFTLFFADDTTFTRGLILWVAALTMVTGVLGAAAQKDFRRILSFHIVSQIGYMILGLGLFTPLALAGGIFYIAHHIVVKTNLFLVAGIVARVGGASELARLGGLYRGRPLIAFLFLVPALSLAGLPPLSGFFAKLFLVRAGLEKEAFLVVGVALAVGLLTLFSMTKIWAEAFWKEAPGDARPGREPGRAMLWPSVALASITVGIGLLAGPMLRLSMRAADQLLTPAAYVSAVLGAR